MPHRSVLVKELLFRTPLSSASLPLRVLILHSLLVFLIRIRHILNAPLIPHPSPNLVCTLCGVSICLGNSWLPGTLRGGVYGSAGWVGRGGLGICVARAITDGGVRGGGEGGIRLTRHSGSSRVVDGIDFVAPCLLCLGGFGSYGCSVLKRVGCGEAN